MLNPVQALLYAGFLRGCCITREAHLSRSVSIELNFKVEFNLTDFVLVVNIFENWQLCA